MQSLCLATARLKSSSLAPLTAHLSSNRITVLDRRASDHTSSIALSPMDAPRFTPIRARISAQPSQGLGLGFAVGKKQQRGSRAVCHASLGFHPCTLQWISAVSTVILMLTRGSAINKSYLVPLFALQAPSSVIGWIKGDYGAWSAFLALLVRLFFFIPGELELPFMSLLFVIVAPYQAMNTRGSQPASIISLAIAGYLAFQHFSREGSLKKAFSQGGLVATLAIILITVIPLLLFI